MLSLQFLTLFLLPASDGAMCPLIYLGGTLEAHLGDGVFSTTDSITLPSALLKATGPLQVNKNIFKAFPRSLIFKYKSHHVFGALTSSTVNLLYLGEQII